MEVFVNRDPTGYVTFELEDIEELEEQLAAFSKPQPLELSSQVRVEITGTWSEIKVLLGQPFFNDFWFDPQQRQPR